MAYEYGYWGSAELKGRGTMLRHRLRLTFLLVAITMLSSCQILDTSGGPTSAQTAERLQAWVGRHQDALFVQFGAPSSTVSLSNGGKVLEFTLTSGRIRCSFLFETNTSGIVIGYKFGNGNDRICYAPRR